MAGIYIHIPFCRQACHYCDFHFSTNLKTKDDMVRAIAEELTERSEYIDDRIHTIYFGGGTPSLLNTHQVDLILQTINRSYAIDPLAEITLEANPEDLSLNKSRGLFDLGINRLSIGIQTFEESKLKWMNRAHDRAESIRAFENARSSGFENISLDLIYAIPDHSQLRWEHDLKCITELHPEHISLYGLTIEEKTVFGKWEQQNKIVQVPEDETAQQYLFAIDYLTSRGYIQYEVSNFGIKGYHSRHNNSYWSGNQYLGVGPGAHSFDGRSRRFNIRNNVKYINAIRDGTDYSETEVLSDVQRVNEQILTQLRTTNGLNLDQINSLIQEDFLSHHSDFIHELLSQKLVEISDGYLSLKPTGFLVADEIALRLFYPE